MHIVQFRSFHGKIQYNYMYIKVLTLGVLLGQALVTKYREVLLPLTDHNQGIVYGCKRSYVRHMLSRVIIYKGTAITCHLLPIYTYHNYGIQAADTISL